MRSYAMEAGSPAKKIARLTYAPWRTEKKGNGGRN